MRASGREEAAARMAPVIKVCGIQTPQEACEVLSEGATAIGVIVGTTHRAEDDVTVDAARRIVEAVSPGTRTIMVTHLGDAETIASLVREVGARGVQLHGELSAAGVERVAELLPGCEVSKAIHVQDESAIANAERYAHCVDWIVLDTRTEERLGGTGRTHDWSISRRIVAALDVPVVLAGGLGPENVADAIRAVNPAGIDANSGLERADGTKDAARVRQFAAAARRHLQGF